MARRTNRIVMQMDAIVGVRLVWFFADISWEIHLDEEDPSYGSQ